MEGRSPPDGVPLYIEGRSLWKSMFHAVTARVSRNFDDCTPCSHDVKKWKIQGNKMGDILKDKGRG